MEIREAEADEEPTSRKHSGKMEILSDSFQIKHFTRGASSRLRVPESAFPTNPRVSVTFTLCLHWAR